MWLQGPLRLCTAPCLAALLDASEALASLSRKVGWAAAARLPNLEMQAEPACIVACTLRRLAWTLAIPLLPSRSFAQVSIPVPGGTGARLCRRSFMPGGSPALP